MSTNAFNETEIVHILASQLITVASMADTPSFFDCIVSYVDHPNSGSVVFVVAHYRSCAFASPMRLAVAADAVSCC